MSERLLRLWADHGQSPWLDNLRRSDLASGRLASLVDAGVRGLTSNPTIFQKAIDGSDDYDEQFFGLLSRGVPVRDAYWDLVVTDIEAALDAFRSLYDSSDGSDGFVSVEVDPSLARDTDRTLEAARALDERIDRPNVMIKIPATTEGLPAIRRMIAEGRNVNVTLIFSLERYEQVIEAHISGLEDRAASGSAVDRVASVASFFISRVDTEIDDRLAQIGGAARELQGRAAVSQASLAYDLAARAYGGERWARLAALGARPQRPLWASTSTKNPAYPDTLYVDSLIGPGTVNTLPEATLEAFADHGRLARTIDADLDAARRSWNAVADAGVDVDEVASLLEEQGLRSFVDSFESLLSSLESKAASSARG